MAMSQTYVISSDFGHDIFHGSVDQLIQWTSCLDCLINITLCYMLCYIGPMGPNLPISEIKPFNQSINQSIDFKLLFLNGFPSLMYKGRNASDLCGMGWVWLGLGLDENICVH